MRVWEHSTVTANTHTHTHTHTHVDSKRFIIPFVLW